jgi:hypothetical protein
MYSLSMREIETGRSNEAKFQATIHDDIWNGAVKKFTRERTFYQQLS